MTALEIPDKVAPHAYNNGFLHVLIPANLISLFCVFVYPLILLLIIENIKLGKFDMETMICRKSPSYIYLLYQPNTPIFEPSIVLNRLYIRY